MDKARRFRQRVRMEKGKLQDREIFSSPRYAKMLKAIAKEITDCGFDNVFVDCHTQNGIAGSCDPKQIVIYIRNVITSSFPTAELKNRSIVGILAHECGHKNYSNTTAKVTYLEGIQKGIWYPRPPHPENEGEREDLEQMKAYFQEKDKDALPVICGAAFYIRNILEDKFCEEKMCQRFPGSVSIGIRQNRYRKLELIPSLKEQIHSGFGNVAVTINLISQYALSGTYNNWDGYQGEILDVLESAKHEVDRAVAEESGSMRIIATNHILLKMWRFLREEIEEIKKKREERDREAEKGPENEVEDEPENGLESEEENEKGSGPESEGENEEESRPESKDENEAGNEPESEGENEEDNEPESEGENEEGSKPESEGENEVGSGPESEDENEEGSKTENEGENEPEDEPEDGAGEDALEKFLQQLRSQIPDFIRESSGDGTTGEIPGDVEWDGAWDTGDGQAGRDMLDVATDGGPDEKADPTAGTQAGPQAQEGGGPLADADDQLQAVLFEMAKERALHSIHVELMADMNRELSEVEFREGHQEVQKVLLHSECAAEGAAWEYESVKQQVKRITQRLNASVLPILRKKENRAEHKLLLGKRIDVRNITNRSGKIFLKKHFPGQDSGTVVGVLIDMSGSMQGRRIALAKTTALCIYEFCQIAQIPVTVYGHHTDGYMHARLRDEQVFLHSCAEFEPDGEDRYRIMELKAEGANRDGTALIYMGAKLLERTERQKLLILISDGLPNSNYYRNEGAKQDLTEIKKDIRKKGVTFLAAAIGEDKEAIEEIYQESFLDISDIGRMPAVLSKKMLGLIRRE